jgi:hypothetical protein
MIHIVFGAFFTAGIADLRTDLANLMRKLGTARHFAFGKRANVGAAAIQADATFHHFGIFLLQAGGGAMIARCGAIVTGLDTFFETVV